MLITSHTITGPPIALSQPTRLSIERRDMADERHITTLPPFLGLAFVSATVQD
jgi:hypothetical protein